MKWKLFWKEVGGPQKGRWFFLHQLRVEDRGRPIGPIALVSCRVGRSWFFNPNGRRGISLWHLKTKKNILMNVHIHSFFHNIPRYIHDDMTHTWLRSSPPMQPYACWMDQSYQGLWVRNPWSYAYQRVVWVSTFRGEAWTLILKLINELEGRKKPPDRSYPIYTISLPSPPVRTHQPVRDPSCHGTKKHP